MGRPNQDTDKRVAARMELEAQYKGDREFFQQRDMEQCREISRNHIKIDKLEAQNKRLNDRLDALKEIANQKLCSEMPISGDIEAGYDQCILTARAALEEVGDES